MNSLRYWISSLIVRGSVYAVVFKKLNLYLSSRGTNILSHFKLVTPLNMQRQLWTCTNISTHTHTTTDARTHHTVLSLSHRVSHSRMWHSLSQLSYHRDDGQSACQQWVTEFDWQLACLKDLCVCVCLWGPANISSFCDLIQHLIWNFRGN